MPSKKGNSKKSASIIGFRVPDQILDQLRKDSEADCISIPAVCRRIIVRFYHKNTQPQQLNQEEALVR